jgi:hypothetical protein
METARRDARLLGAGEEFRSIAMQGELRDKVMKKATTITSMEMRMRRPGTVAIISTKHLKKVYLLPTVVI